MNFLNKLDYLMAEKDINKSILSKESGIPYTTIDSFYKKGYQNTKLPTIQKLCDYFGVTLDYLMRDEVNDPQYGKGSKFDPLYFESHEEKSSAPTKAEAEKLEQDERKLLENYRMLNADGKATAQDTVEGLTYMPKYKKCTDSQELA